MPLWLADLIHRVCKQICAIILTLPLNGDVKEFLRNSLKLIPHSRGIEA